MVLFESSVFVWYKEHPFATNKRQKLTRVFTDPPSFLWKYDDPKLEILKLAPKRVCGRFAINKNQLRKQIETQEKGKMVLTKMERQERSAGFLQTNDLLVVLHT